MLVAVRRRRRSMASELEPTSGRRRARASAAEGDTAANGGAPSARALDELLRALNAAAAGDFAVRLPSRYGGVMGELADAYNRMAEGQQRASKELARVGRAVGRDGRIAERAVAEQVQRRLGDQPRRGQRAHRRPRPPHRRDRARGRGGGARRLLAAHPAGAGRPRRQGRVPARRQGRQRDDRPAVRPSRPR